MWKKVAGPALLVGILWIAGGGATTYYIMRLQASLAKVLRESMAAVRLANEMEATLWKLHAAVIEAGHYSRPHLHAGGSEAELQFERALESLRRVAKTELETEQIDLIRDSFSQYCEVAHRQLARTEASVPTVTDDTARHAAMVAGYCKDFLGLEQRLLTEAIEHYGQVTHGVNALRLILFCSGPVIGILIGVGVMRSLKWSEHRLNVHLRDPGMETERDLGHVEISSSPALPALQVQEVPGRSNQGTGQLVDRAQPNVVAGDLAAGIAHELRNPLTSLKLLIQAAARKQRDRPLSDKQFQILLDEITRMEGSIQSLLDFTRPPQVRRRIHNVCDTLRRSLNLVRKRASQNGVNILEGIPSERVMVCGDPEQLHHVFVNLLLNGMEAMPDGGVLRVAIGGIAEGDRMCRIKCSDSGSGIAPDILEHIFEPFVSGKEHGHGLGLAVSRRIIAEHGGSLVAANHAEGGTLFTVALPFVSIDRETKQFGSDLDLAVQRPASDPDLAVRPSDPDLAVRPSDPDLAVRPSDPDLAVRPSDPDLAAQRPASDPDLAVSAAWNEIGRRG
jgi:two-component system, NtrC family, sensor histidine kinase HydH